MRNSHLYIHIKVVGQRQTDHKIRRIEYILHISVYVLPAASSTIWQTSILSGRIQYNNAKPIIQNLFFLLFWNPLMKLPWSRFSATPTFRSSVVARQKHKNYDTWVYEQQKWIKANIVRPSKYIRTYLFFLTFKRENVLACVV